MAREERKVTKYMKQMEKERRRRNRRRSSKGKEEKLTLRGDKLLAVEGSGERAGGT